MADEESKDLVKKKASELSGELKKMSPKARSDYMAKKVLSQYKDVFGSAPVSEIKDVAKIMPKVATPIMSRLAGPVGMALSAKDFYDDLQDPQVQMALTRVFGGEEQAYNMWAEGQEKEGRTVPSYAEYSAKKKKRN